MLHKFSYVVLCRNVKDGELKNVLAFIKNDVIITDGKQIFKRGTERPARSIIY